MADVYLCVCINLRVARGYEAHLFLREVAFEVVTLVGIIAEGAG